MKETQCIRDGKRRSTFTGPKKYFVLCLL